MSEGRSVRSFAAALLCTALAPAWIYAGPEPAPPAARRNADPGAWKERVESFPLRLDERLRREARRFPDLTAAPVDPAVLEQDTGPDEGTRAARGRRVERLLTRAIRGALDDHLTDRARESGTLPGLFRLLDARDDDKDAAGAGPLLRRGVDTEAVGNGGSRTTFRLRLDAHPRLQVRARMGPVTGSIEVPVLDPELRFGLERPLGARGRAALSGGHSDERGGWASLALSFGF
jgi:hypothetical protein